MPRRCCVPGCKSNYDSTLKNGEKPVSTFVFPQDENLRSRWTRAIPRANWQPSKGSFVCCKHFSENEVIRSENMRKSDGTREVIILRNPKLIDGAVPHIFPNLPQYLTQKKISSRVDPSKRQKVREQRCEELHQKLQEQDTVKGFQEFKFKIYSNKHNSVYCDWNVKIFDNHVYFYTLNIDGEHSGKSQNVCVQNSICVNSELKVNVYLGANELPANDLSWVLPSSLNLTKWSQFENLLARYKNQSFQCTEHSFQSNLTKAVEYLESALNCSNEQDCLSKKVDLIKEQVKLSMLKKPRYSISTIIFAFLVFCISQSCYEFLRGFMFLPNKRYLQYLSSSLNINPSDLDNTNHYLKMLYSKLAPRERVVNLCIDEIYVNSKLEYKAKKVTGYSENNSNDLAKTVVCFMIASSFGKFKEVVRLIPVNALTGKQLKDYTLEVINFIQLIGFQIICILADNNRVNQNMYSLITGGNHSRFSNPNISGKTIYCMYDPVHIFKNIRNNWLNLRSPGKAFHFYDYTTGILKMACFDDIEKLYRSESTKCVKKAYKLNSKTLYPSSLERQNVTLVDNLFHISTIAALKSNPDSQSTGDFLEIIRKWWNILNVKSKLKGVLKHDPDSCCIDSAEHYNINHLISFIDWLDKWVCLPGGSFLSKDTFNALRVSTLVIIEIVKTTFKEFNIEYILLGKFQSDCIEKRFGHYRYLSGCNYHVSCTQIIESEKKIRLKHILKFEDIVKGMKNLKEDQELSPMDPLPQTDGFECVLASDYLEVCDIDESSQIYICGYAVHKLSTKLKCIHCISTIKESKGDCINNEYFDYLQRGGLSLPTDSVKFVCFHLYALFNYIIQQTDLKTNFFKLHDMRSMLSSLTILSLQADNFFIDIDGCCEAGHSLKSLYFTICKTLSNIMLNNFLKTVNGLQAEQKQTKKTNLKRKLNVFLNN